jgi:NAD-dependent dihydropyrimidine dehydrogenase PreA subunit
VQISPDTCDNCRLCENACPVNAIRTQAAEPVKEERGRSIKRLKIYGALLPLWIIALAAAGWFSADIVSSVHPHVKLLKVIELEESGAAATKSLESEALRVDAEVIAELKRLSDTAKNSFRWGLTLLGIYLGIVVGGHLIRQSTYRKRGSYDADPALCVACGRCYGYCPKHKAEKGKPKWMRDANSC